MKLNRLFAAAFVAILLLASHAGANAAEAIGPIALSQAAGR
ncbi:hypothetical protein [Massilia sp. IC2-477]|nr:hypothetical protein [Massilia sp. IC2-477]